MKLFLRMLAATTGGAFLGSGMEHALLQGPMWFHLLAYGFVAGLLTRWAIKSQRELKEMDRHTQEILRSIELYRGAPLETRTPPEDGPS